VDGNAGNYAVPAGKCQDNGIGEIVRAFRIGTQQLMPTQTAGSVFDDGVDFANGTFNQNAAFTANIVAAKIVQLVKAPTLNPTTGVFTLGQWASGSTFLNYGDPVVVSGRLASVLCYVGWQSFPFTAGSGYANGTFSQQATCTTVTSGGYGPWFDITVAGGSIVDVYPSAASHSTQLPTGLGVGTTCTVPLTPLTGGTGAAIATIPLAPFEGSGGIGTYNTDSNTMGMFLYDNTGLLGNPLNSFFTNGMGGYFEPGNALRPLGMFQGLAVSG
jgi:hypothetical protein